MCWKAMLIRGSAIAVLVSIAGCATGPEAARREATPAQEAPPAAQTEHIRQLRLERRDLLKTLADATRLRVEKGQAALDELGEVLVAWRKAEIDLCETPAERVRVHEQLVADLRDVEVRFERLLAAGRSVESTGYQAKARRLKAEIDLAQAQLAAHVAAPSRLR